jgi:hypothetical protein
LRTPEKDHDAEVRLSDQCEIRQALRAGGMRDFTIFEISLALNASVAAQHSLKEALTAHHPRIRSFCLRKDSQQKQRFHL